MTNFENDRKQRFILPESNDEAWEELKESIEGGRFPERYVEGLERQMAEALWEREVQEKYPGLTVHNQDDIEIPTPLYLAAAGNVYDTYAIGLAGDTIRRAKICAEVARNIVGTEQ